MSVRSAVECNGCGLTVAMQEVHDYPQGWTSVIANARTCAPTIQTRAAMLQGDYCPTCTRRIVLELERKVERLKAV